MQAPVLNSLDDLSSLDKRTNVWAACSALLVIAALILFEGSRAIFVAIPVTATPYAVFVTKVYNRATCGVCRDGFFMRKGAWTGNGFGSRRRERCASCRALLPENAA